MRIDIHTHTYFQDFADYLTTRNEFPNVVVKDGQLITACSPAFSIASPPGHREVEAKVRAMEDMGIDFSVLSHGIPGPELLGGGGGRRLGDTHQRLPGRRRRAVPGQVRRLGEPGVRRRGPDDRGG